MEQRFAGNSAVFSEDAPIFAGMSQRLFERIPSLFFGIVAFLSVCSLCAWWVGQKDGTLPANKDHFSERVNLALRRTAHYLLTEAGDTTSRIAPVQQIDAHSWLVRLEHDFNYDRLPVLLQQSFEMQGISENYNVEVVHCLDGSLQLGYNFEDYKQNNDAPCGGRATTLDCINLQVQFITPAENRQNGWWGWALGAIAILSVFLFVMKRHWNRTSMANTATSIDLSGQLSFGQSTLHTANQLLFSAGKKHTLTYRESKLLHFFASHPNQLLERDFILQSVWEDEGIIVGRSVDVFVSRLRKLLREDAQVRIVAVHGVGYRLEILA